MRRALLAVIASLAAAGATAAPVGTSFTYQGRLTTAGVLAEGTIDLQLILYDAAVGGSQVGTVILTPEDVPVTQGVFTVSLDFGPVLDGTPLFLEVGVRPGTSAGAYSILSPRQELTPAPHALFSGTTGDPTMQRRTVPPTCSSGEYLRSVAASGAPTCAFDLDTNGGGTVTSIGAGSGLTGGVITLSGTVAVGFGGNGAATTVARSDHDHDSSYQRKVTGSCPPGSSIQRLNPDGSVACLQAGLGAGPTITEPSPAFASFPAMTIGAFGLPLVSHSGGFNAGLSVTRCSNTLCTAATTFTHDVGADVWRSSITVGADGLGLVAYWDRNFFDLKVAHCEDAPCSAATVTTVDGDFQDDGAVNAIATGADGLGLIAYLDNTNGDLKVAHCQNVACTSSTNTIVDSAGFTGSDPSIAIGTDGLALVSYGDYNGGGLHVAHCTNLACSAATLSTIDFAANGAFNTSIAIGADGLGLVSYHNGTLRDFKVAHCNNPLCTTGTSNTFDSAGDQGPGTSLAIGADGLGIVSYRDSTNTDLKVAHCTDLACSAVTVQVLDGLGGEVGLDNSIAIGTDGLPFIAYYNNNNGRLRVAHCGNLLCSPFVGKQP